MYGMIHRAIYEMLAERNSVTEWERLRVGLNIDPDRMISTLVYPDCETLQLVDEAAGLLGIPVFAFFEELGRYWITFVERGSYKHIMNFTGGDLPSFIENLDQMHRAVATAMPGASVPSFRLVASAPGELSVDYRSNRDGLEPLVIGLLRGLIERFGHAGDVHFVGQNDGASRFVLRFS